MEPSDREIIARVLAGDRDRFLVLVERHGRALLGYVGQTLPDPEDAREVYQQTWVRAFERLASLRDPDRLRSWMITIAGNLLRQRFRDLRVAPVSLEAIDVEPAGESAVDRLQREEELGELRRAVEALPARQREVCRLRAQQELSYAEIAEILEIREENARAHFYQALRKLRAALAPRSEETDPLER